MKFIFLLFLLISPFILAEDKSGSSDAAKIEMILRQQRELEANELILTARKHHEEGRFERAIGNYIKAVHLYEKSSASEKRIINKIKEANALLVDAYKKLAGEIMKKAEKESSVELFEKAEKILLKAQKLNRKNK